MTITIETLYFGVYRIIEGDMMESNGYETEERVREFFDERNGYTNDDQDQWIEKREIKTQKIAL